MHLNVRIRHFVFVNASQASYELEIARVLTRTELNVFYADGYLESVYTCVEFFVWSECVKVGKGCYVRVFPKQKVLYFHQ